jgi:hypothetical protein
MPTWALAGKGDILLTQVRSQSDWLGAPIDLLMSRGTVAAGIIGRTVEKLTAVSGAERVGIRREGITPLRA